MQAPDHVLELAHVSKTFGGLKAVDDMTFGVERGTVLGLIGPNGAGKTTLINLLSGMDTPNEGTVSINGEVMPNGRAHVFARKGVARTFQNMKLFKGMTVLEHVMVGLDKERHSRFWQIVLPYPPEWRERKKTKADALSILARVGLEGEADRQADTLPYGSQRRLEIARALALRPKVLLLDEPTAGMNSAESNEVGELVRSLVADGVSVLVVEHNISFVRDFCDHIVVVSFGRKIAEGDPHSTLDLDVVREAYLGASGDERVERLKSMRKVGARAAQNGGAAHD